MSSYALPVILTILVVVGVVVFIKLRKKKKAKEDFWKLGTETRVATIISNWKHSIPDATTRFGVKVYRQLDATSINDPTLDSIDAGFAETIDRLICAGYSAASMEECRGMEVVLLESEHTPGNNIGFRVKISAQSPYLDLAYRDPDGTYYIYAAGQFVFNGRIALADPKGNYAFLRDAAQYEKEHDGLLRHDRDRFAATMIHGEGTGHPILSPCQGLAHPVNERYSPVQMFNCANCGAPVNLDHKLCSYCKTPLAKNTDTIQKSCTLVVR